MIFNPPQSDKTDNLLQHCWSTRSLEIAQRLLDHIPIISQKLFSDGDLTTYLSLMCRMPYYHFLNLLLIYEKYPTAVCLASTKIWKKFLPPDTPNVIKPDHVQKSVLLLAPFTNNIETKLQWYSIKVYDISQTDVSSLILPKDVYVHDSQHLDFLLDSIEDTLEKYYGIRVFIGGNSSTYSITYPGHAIDDNLVVSGKLSDELKLYWLTENLCEQFIKKKRFLLDSSGILIQTLCLCLFKIWGISYQSLPIIPKGSYRVIPLQEQHSFLNILQHSLYEINQQITSAYLNARNEADLITVKFDLN